MHSYERLISRVVQDEQLRSSINEVIFFISRRENLLSQNLLIKYSNQPKEKVVQLVPRQDRELAWRLIMHRNYGKSLVKYLIKDDDEKKPFQDSSLKKPVSKGYAF